MLAAHPDWGGSRVGEEPASGSSGSGRLGGGGGGDEIHFAPPKKPRKDDSPRKYKHWIQPWIQRGAGFRPSTV